jgi:hypothetical protein
MVSFFIFCLFISRNDKTRREEREKLVLVDFSIHVGVVFFFLKLSNERLSRLLIWITSKERIILASFFFEANRLVNRMSVTL